MDGRVQFCKYLSITWSLIRFYSHLLEHEVPLYSFEDYPLSPIHFDDAFDGWGWQARLIYNSGEPLLSFDPAIRTPFHKQL
jgi:hypothetical protein